MSSRLYGVIRLLPDGIPQCVEAGKRHTEAKASLLRLAAKEPGEFFIYSELTGVIVDRVVSVEEEEVLDEPKSTTQLLSTRHRFLS
jgi:hypothetical protein